MTKEFKLTLPEAVQKAEFYMKEGYHCGPSILQVMREALGVEDDQMVFAGVNLFGGLTRHREGVCGTVSAMAVYLGFLYQVFPDDKEGMDRVNKQSFDISQAFKDEYGSIVCQELLGITDFNEEERAQFFAEKKYEKQCNGYLRFIIEKLYELGVEPNE